MSKSFLQKIFNSVYWFFIIESGLILFGIYIDAISYGIDIQTPFMAVGISFAAIVVSIIYFIVKSLNSSLKKILAKLLLFIMVLLSAYYLLEDHFMIKY